MGQGPPVPGANAGPGESAGPGEGAGPGTDDDGPGANPAPTPGPPTADDPDLGHTPLLDGRPAFKEAADALKPFTSAERVASFERVLSERTSHVRFVIEDPINPSNAWACLRTLDSFGVQYVDVITNPVRHCPLFHTKPLQLHALINDAFPAGTRSLF